MKQYNASAFDLPNQESSSSVMAKPFAVSFCICGMATDEKPLLAPRERENR